MAKQKAVVATPKGDPVAPPATTVDRPKCPVCQRDFKSPLALAIHTGFAHKAGPTGGQASPMAKPGKVPKVKATPAGMLRVSVPLDLVGPVVALLKAAGLTPIMVE